MYTEATRAGSFFVDENPVKPVACTQRQSYEMTFGQDCGIYSRLAAGITRWLMGKQNHVWKALIILVANQLLLSGARKTPDLWGNLGYPYFYVWLLALPSINSSLAILLPIGYVFCRFWFRC
jgi:hypothetical protein